MVGDFELARWLDAELERRGRGAAAKLARDSRLSEQVISRLRNGERQGDWETLTMLARGFGMTRAELVAAVDGQPLPPHEPEDRTVVAIKSDPTLTYDDARVVLDVYQRVRRLPPGRPRRGRPPAS